MDTKRDISEAVSLLAMMMTPGIGIVTLNRLTLALNEAGVPLHAVVGGTDSMLTRGLPAGLEWAVKPLSCCESATIDRAAVLHQRVLETGGQWIIQSNADYPHALVRCMEYQAPPFLTVYGDTQLVNTPGVSIVGARDASEHGLSLAREMASWAVAQQRTVISGGAQGIDSAAHQKALEAGGNSCFFIPEGSLNYSGPKWLGEYIESGHAAIVSQCVPDFKWSTSGALTRNRSIAALGELVCVIDPAAPSGSRQTAEHALGFGKRTLVYAYDKLNSAYHELVQAGAYPAISETGQWDHSYMEQHWRNRSQAIQEQADLF